jgi:hypothetical protein
MAYLMPQGPIATAKSNLVQSQMAVVSQNPTDYVSPQSAIAAGLDPVKVNAAWAQALAKYSTQQDAIAAGIAPTVITQYWQASRAYVAAPPKPSLFTPTNLLIGGGLLFLLSRNGKGTS